MAAGFSSVELCAGVGGQALGLEAAGFIHEALVEIDPHCRQTLRLNRKKWHVPDGDQSDLLSFDGTPFKNTDLVAGGLPCPPFSRAGKQLGERDERNLFGPALRIIREIKPKAVMLENVRGFLDARFSDFRDQLRSQFGDMGYVTDWKVLYASEFGVPQLRPRVTIVALRNKYADKFSWPDPTCNKPATVGETLYQLMAENGWRGAKPWRDRADAIAPTIVGGSKKHGGADLGPTRAKQAWLALGVNGKSIADEAPDPDFVGLPRLTVNMIAKLQALPADWQITGGKTAASRQVGNAFPPPVASAVAKNIANALT